MTRPPLQIPLNRRKIAPSMPLSGIPGWTSLLAVSLALSAPLGAGQLYVTRDAKGRSIVTNMRRDASSRPLSGGTLSVATREGSAAKRPVPLMVVESGGAERRVSPEKQAKYVEHVSAAAARRQHLDHEPRAHAVERAHPA